MSRRKDMDKQLEEFIQADRLSRGEVTGCAWFLLFVPAICVIWSIA